MAHPSSTVKLSSALIPAFVAVGAAVGLGLALAVGPAVGWMLDRLDSAPAPLRLLDQLPLVWAIPLLTVLGAVAGWLVFSMWSEKVGRVLVDERTVRLENKKATVEFSRDEIAQIFLDKDELVLLDGASQELSRTDSESGLAESFAQAFGTFEYPWLGTTDPRETAFTDWVDRSKSLNEATHQLLRARRRALTDGKVGEAESLREQLAAQGVVVRDRGERQQYRLSTTE